MTKTFAITLFAASCLMGGVAQAQSTSAILVEFQGPGGHSSGNYGRTSALHAAARAVVELQKSMPVGSYSVAYLTGGNSVNSIASDGSFTVKLSASAGMTAGDFLTKVTLAAKNGADTENAFRNVKPGNLTAGAPADIRYSVTQQ